MSTVLRIVSSQAGLFGLDGDGPGGSVEPAGAWDETCISRHHGKRLVRLHPGRGYVINEGPETLRLFYTHKGRRVGPISDFLAPGQCREIGIGEGVKWEFEEAAKS